MYGFTLPDQVKGYLWKGGAAALVLLLTFMLGCLHGQSRRTAAHVEIDTPHTVDSWHRDSVEQHIIAKDSGSFTIAGAKQSNGRVKFQGVAPTASGATDVNAEYDPETNTLTGTIREFVEVRVPEIILTHATSTVIPYKVFVPEAPQTSGWTWAGVGAAIGSLVTIIGFALLHIHL